MTLRKLVLALCLFASSVYGQNQTPDTTPILLQGSDFAFDMSIAQASFSLPVGLQSYIFATTDDEWVFLAGRTNGLHGFNNTGDFPPSQQNTSAYVVNPTTGATFSKSFLDPSSGLTQAQVDLLSVTASEFHQSGNTLYLVGGYGIDTATNTFSTKDSLTAIDVPGLIHWIVNPSPGETAAQHIRQTTHPFLQVTGAEFYQASPHQPLLLFFGQNFAGDYTPGSNGNYTNQVRCLQILDNGRSLYVLPTKSAPPNASFRRRDLNVVPIIQKRGTTYVQSFVELSGVFTVDGGIWTVPVLIDGNGIPFMPDPTAPGTFKQGMNNYASSILGLFSKSTDTMYILSFGGLSYQTYQGGTFVPDPEIPFNNGISTVVIDSDGNFSQYLMNNTYPALYSTFSNPGNLLLFGTSSEFIAVKNLPTFPNGVLQLDQLGHQPVLVGYIVGGIQSTLPNTNTMSDSAASPYIFTVTLTPR